MSHFSLAVLTNDCCDVDEVLEQFDMERQYEDDRYESALDYAENAFNEVVKILTHKDGRKFKLNSQFISFHENLLINANSNQIDFLKKFEESSKNVLIAKFPNFIENKDENIILTVLNQTVKVLDYKNLKDMTFSEEKIGSLYPSLKDFIIDTYNPRIQYDVYCEDEELLEESEDCDYSYLLKLNEKSELVDFLIANYQGQYDWYVIGGRWDNMLITKDGQHVNTCKISELDIDGFLKAKEKKLRNVYKQFEEILGDTPKDWLIFSECVNQSMGNIKEAREIYFNQEAVQKFKGNDLFSSILGCDLDNFKVTLDEFLNKSIGAAFETCCLLDATGDESLWLGSEVGMFGSLIREELDWSKKFAKILEEKQDFYITIVDCHC